MTIRVLIEWTIKFCKREDIIIRVNDYLESCGITLGEPSTLFLYDPEMEMDFDIEFTTDVSYLVRRLGSWPLMGCGV